MPLAGPFTCLDYTATPTQQPDGQGGTVSIYPALSGVFYICDPATYAASRAALDAYKVTAPKGADGVSAQHIMGGDDATNPTQTITFSFPDQATADPVVAQVAATPVPAPDPVPAGVPSPPRTISLLDFKLRIPAAKAMAILAARATDPEIAYADEMINSVGGPNGPMVDLDDPLVRQYVADLVTKGYLTADDQTVILA